MSDELTALADDLDSFVHDMREDGNDASALWLEQRASALRTIAAAGEHKPQPGWDRGELLECAQWLEHGASLAVSAASKEQGELAARALREFADSNASAEARLREALEFARICIWNGCDTIEALSIIDKALSAHPHASDCEKQGDTTKSEGGGQVAPAKCSATGVHPTDTSCAAEPEVAPGPSDRPADVTLEELAKFICREIPICIHSRVGDFLARALLDAFTVGRRP